MKTMKMSGLSLSWIVKRYWSVWTIGDRGHWHCCDEKEKGDQKKTAESLRIVAAVAEPSTSLLVSDLSVALISDRR